MIHLRSELSLDWLLSFGLFVLLLTSTAFESTSENGAGRSPGLVSYEEQKMTDTSYATFSCAIDEVESPTWKKYISSSNFRKRPLHD